MFHIRPRSETEARSHRQFSSPLEETEILFDGSIPNCAHPLHSSKYTSTIYDSPKSDPRAMPHSLFFQNQEGRTIINAESWMDFLKTWKNISEPVHTKTRCLRTSYIYAGIYCLNPFLFFFLLHEYSHVSPTDVSLHRRAVLPPCSRCATVSPTRILFSGQGRIPRCRVRPRLPPDPQDGVEGAVWISFLKESPGITRCITCYFHIT